MIGQRLHDAFGTEENRAVSPVIGVILMVAITVILAAVIATFVLGVGDDIQEDPQAGVSIDDADETEVEVSVTSLGNADGVALVHPSNGSVIENDTTDLILEPEDGILNATGTGVTVQWEGDEESANVNVVAYIGEGVEDDGGPVSEQAEATATINDFEVVDPED
ncbi:type IV pilin [Natronobacterium texcoconense]|uniref:type IV pilin n=1 Tax=Natronobacterium texcoconense TaxID=1095778 RepID=UPI000A4AD653|nr:type IV pilin N-terminal domain-containing protein [Natronobacterium texcoconense]